MEKLESECENLKKKITKLDIDLNIKTNKLEQLKKQKKECEKNNDDYIGTSKYKLMSYDELNDLIKNNKIKLKLLNTDLINSENIVEVSDDTETLYKKKHDLTTTKENILTQKAQIIIPDMNRSQKEFNEKHQTISSFANTLEETVIKYKQIIKYLSDNESEYKQYAQLKDMVESKKTIENEYSIQHDAILRSKQILEKLKKHEYDPDCDYCCNNDIVQDAESIKEKYPSLSKKYKIIKTKYNEYLENCDKLESGKVMFDKYNEKLIQKKNIYDLILNYMEKSQDIKFDSIDYILEIKKNNILTEKYDHVIDKINKIEQQIKDVNASILKNTKSKQQISALNDKIGEMQLYLKHKSSKKTSDKKSNYVSINNDIDKLTAEITELQISSVKNISTLEYSSTECKKINDKLIKINKLIIEFEEHKLFVEAVSESGIQAMLVRKFIPIIEQSVNEMLERICDFTIGIECINDKVIVSIINSNIEIKSSNACDAGGFEKGIINICLRIAFGTYSCLARPSIFIIDEILSNMDGNNRNNISELFTLLKSNFKNTIIVSHLVELKSSVDKQITPVKTNGYSSVKHTII